jgi:hypothetical protein
LLEDTLVVWGGEFGRTPMVETNAAIGRSMGRDHHPVAYSMWMAGGGVKGGHVHGETDELGFRIARDPVHVHDLQATILHLLGLDHKRLIYHYQGRDFRLTDVAGEVVKGILRVSVPQRAGAPLSALPPHNIRTADNHPHPRDGARAHPPSFPLHTPRAEIATKGSVPALSADSAGPIATWLERL